MKVRMIAVIAIIGVAGLGVMTIARYRHAPAPMATDSSLSTTVFDVQPDMLVAAGAAPMAPSFAAGAWINSDALTVEKLRGRVVLVEFWTFGCYNCRNTLPSVKDWDAKYRDRGLTIVGVHTPETDSEYRIDNVHREVPALGIKYPVVTDNDYKTWKAYNVEAWPTIFVIDKQGRIRWLHVGEGRYDETESVVKILLAE
jgi:thiol-disulfide isomerase/thioredoxin